MSYLKIMGSSQDDISLPVLIVLFELIYMASLGIANSGRRLNLAGMLRTNERHAAEPEGHPHMVQSHPNHIQKSIKLLFIFNLQKPEMTLQSHLTSHPFKGLVF